MTMVSVMRETSRQRDRRNASHFSVTADPGTSASIYNGELKVIVPGVDIRAATELCRLDGRLAIYVCERAGRRRGFEIYRAGAPRGAGQVPLNHPPPFFAPLYVPGNQFDFYGAAHGSLGMRVILYSSARER